MIPEAAFEFFRGLAANNEKAWFEANRAIYESAVRDPLAALVDSVAAELVKRGVPLEGDPKRSMFRIHRDVRFSKDKSPYKTHAGVVWYRQGSGKKPGSGVLYFHLDPAQCFVGAAFYMPDPEALDSIRERIRVRPEEFERVEQALAAKKLWLEAEDKLSRMPRGYEDMLGSPVAAALRLKHFMVRRPLTVGQVQSKRLAGLIAQLGADALPLLQFGWAAIDEVTNTRS